MTPAKSQFNILWLQVCGLAGVQGAITLCWLIYNLYIPQLLAEFGFPKSWVVGILIVENALAVVMEPLMGLLSDKMKGRLGTSFPFISFGVILSSALFIAIPCVVTFTPPLAVLRLILPIALIAWALAMMVFRSPVMALLGRYAVPAELPLAASFITFTATAIGAFRPFTAKWLLSLPAIFPFAIASFVMLGTVSIVRRLHPPNTPSDSTRAQKTPALPLPQLALIFGTGACVAWGSRLLMDALGKLLKIQLAAENVDLQMLGVGIFMAFATIPVGLLTVRLTIKPAMLLGIAATVTSMLIMVYMPTPIPIIFFIIAGFTLIVNAAIPFTLSLTPARWAGLGIGMYFGGFGLAMSVFGLVFPQQQAITPVTGLVSGALAFLLAGVCVGVSRQPKSAVDG